MARPKPKTKTPAQSGKDLAERGASALEHARYKDAVIIYKQLSKVEPHSKWKQGLAQAYRGRAFELAQKALFEEALTVLDNALEQDPSITVIEPIVHYSLALSRFEPAAQRFLRVKAQLNPEQIQRIESMFGLAFLANDRDPSGYFAADSKLVSDFPLVREAILAYCRGDDEALRTQLRQIAFQSPYRDLRMLLSALSSPLTERKD